MILAATVALRVLSAIRGYAVAEQIRPFLAWLLPPLDQRDYTHVLRIFGVIPAAVWTLAALPVAYTALVLFIGLALLLACLL